VPGHATRGVLASGEVAAWFERLMENESVAGQRRGRLAPWVQVDSLLTAFVSRERLGLLATVGMQPPFKQMRPLRLHVWTMRTSDTRLFGWFVHPALFVAVNASVASVLKQIPDKAPGGYSDRIAGVARWREANGCTTVWKGGSHELFAALGQI
jgi:hypothetical protein